MGEISGSGLGGVLGLFGLPGHWEIIIVVLAILLLFGGRKLPELARGLGRGLRIFRKEIKGIQTDIEEGGDQDEQTKEAQQTAQTSDQGDEQQTDQ